MSLEKFNRKNRSKVVLDKDESRPEKRSKYERLDDVSNAPDPSETKVKQDRKETRKEQKLLLQKRREDRPFADVISQLHPLWDLIRQKNTESATRRKSIEQAMSLIEGKEMELSKKSDTSRILQTIIQHGEASERERLAKALGGNANIANDVYGQHVLKKLIKECSRSRDILVKLLRGHVEHFITKRTACGILDEIYKSVNSMTKNHIIRELYSKEFVKFSSSHEEFTNISDYLAKNPAKKDVILNNMRSFIPKLLNKEVLMYHAVQRVILDYLIIEIPSKLSDPSTISPFLSDGHLEVLISSNIGCLIIVRLIAVSSAKDRKLIVKTLKLHFPTMITSNSQYPVILAILSFVDDTVLVGKALVPEIVNSIFSQPQESLDSESTKVALRSLLFLLSGRLSKYITPQMVTMSNECDSLASQTSKKENSTRAQQLLTYAIPLLSAAIETNLVAIANCEILAPVLSEFFVILSDEDGKLLLDSLFSQMGGFSGLCSNEITNKLLRVLIKRTEKIALNVYGHVQSILSDVLSGENGFLIVIMLRFESIYRNLCGRIEEISNINSPAATALKSKLSLPFSENIHNKDSPEK